MKKFLSCCLVAMMLVAVVATSVCAATWTAGAGFNRYSGTDYTSRSDSGVLVPVEMTDNGDGSATVAQGGYYEAPTSWEGGVATNEAVGLNGLEIVVEFDEVPVATGDCWFTISLLENAGMFNTSDFGANKGYVPLIRYGTPAAEAYGVTEFTSIMTGQMDQVFALKAGDVFKCNVAYANGQFNITYTNGDSTFAVPAESTATLDSVFTTGEAHVVVAGSNVGAESDWKYTVKVTEGAALTAEQIAAKEFDKSKGTIDAAIDDFITKIDIAKEGALAAVAGKIYEESIFADIDAAAAEAVAAKEDLAAATDEAGVTAAVEKAQAAYIAAQASADAIAADVEAGFYADDPNAEKADDNKEEAPAEDNKVEENEEAPVEDNAEDKAEESDNTMLYIIIAVVVVVVIVAVVVMGKGKKN